MAVLAPLGLAACSSTSFCGAPCERHPQKPVPALIKRSIPLVNQYGSVFGHMEIDSMTLGQLRIERTSLELLLSGNEKDAEILKVLKEGKLDTATFDYDDYSTGGSRFNSSGKLRRDATVKDSLRQLPRLISESQHREVIERYRRVRRRMVMLANRPVEPVAAAAPVEAPAASTDSLWAGSYRASGDTAKAGSGGFPELAGCEAWAQGISEGFRSKAFAFEYACEKDSAQVRRKLW